MSVALDYGTDAVEFPAESVPFWPADHCPDPIPFWPADPPRRDRGPSADQAVADVVVLPRPRAVPASAPLRLTRRGVMVLGAAVAVLCGALLSVAALSAPASHTPAGAVQAVTVRSGDTLWSIAVRVAPGTDPRAEIDTLQRLNHLTSAQLTPGQTLRTH